MNKISDIFSSARFQQMLIIAVLQSLVLFKIISGDQGTGLINILSTLFGASVLIRTIDRNVGDPKSGATTVTLPAKVSSVTATKKR